MRIVLSFFKNGRGPICMAFIAGIVSLICMGDLTLNQWLIAACSLILPLLFCLGHDEHRSWLYPATVGGITLTVLPVILAFSHGRHLMQFWMMYALLHVFLWYLFDEFVHTSPIIDYDGFRILTPRVNPRTRHLPDPDTLSSKDYTQEEKDRIAYARSDRFKLNFMKFVNSLQRIRFY